MSHHSSWNGLNFRPLGRRGFIKVGALGVGGLSLPLLPQLQALGATSKKGSAQDRSIILFWMAGGPSHLDTYDPKPEAAAEIRGPFGALETKVPGMQLCELLPRQAKLAERLTIIRSIAHNLAVHDDGAHWMQTGYPLLNARARGQTHPAEGAVVSRLKGARQPGMPAYVCIPEDYRSHMGFYQTAAYLGSKYNALNAGGDPSLGNYRPPEFSLPKTVPLARLDDRKNLLASLDRFAAQADSIKQWGELDGAQRQAIELASGSRARQAFDLSQEKQATRESYGQHAYGQGALLARRLVEAGVRFVTINLYEKDVDWWDDHTGIEANLRKRLPPFDQAIATLISDLADRGLSENVLVAAYGEFGRSPRIDKGAGRGHWPGAMSVLLSGGGIRGGQVIGSTAPDGSAPKDRPLTPGHLLATLYHTVGIDPHGTLPDLQNRPIPLVPEGEVIRECVG
ncbi:MAG: DUF1501 domain-containing protein [Pirellulaceae bacterium]